MKKALLILSLMAIVLSGCSGKQSDVSFKSGSDDQTQKTRVSKKILLIQSYWTNYKWGVDIEKGALASLNISPDVLYQELKDEAGLGIKSGIKTQVDHLDITLDIICMDTKRRSDEAWKQESSEKTIAKVNQIKPDVIILADDNAQKYVGMKLVNQYPLVFCGVNNEYTNYYKTTDQVTGLHERLNFKETSDLILEVYPKVKKLIMLTDSTETSTPVIKQLKEAALPFQSVETLTFKTLSAFQSKVKSLQNQKDTALAIFNLNFEDAAQEKAIAWFLKNSKLPEMAFQDNLVRGGLLLTSAVSGTAHGQASVQKAVELLKGKSIDQIPVSVPSKGNVMLNKARASMLGINIPVAILNTAEVVDELEVLK